MWRRKHVLFSNRTQFEGLIERLDGPRSLAAGFGQSDKQMGNRPYDTYLNQILRIENSTRTSR